MKLLLAAVCLLVAGFCGFGFLATLEPGARHAFAFRLVYGVVGLGCVAAILAMAAGVFRSPGGPAGRR